MTPLPETGGGDASGAAAGARVLLVEVLDAAGSARADAYEHGAALRRLGTRVRLAVVDRCLAGSLPPAGRSASTPPSREHWEVPPEGLPHLREMARDGDFDLVLIAAATPGGGTVHRALRGIAPTCWWPTGVAARTWGARFSLGPMPERLPPVLDPSGPDPEVPPGLAWASVATSPPPRGQRTLWDGDYLLVPMPPAGGDGMGLLSAFAALAQQWCGVDLVVLSEPRRAFERAARALGIVPRVHFVGPATREAEWVWWSNARGAVLAGAGALSGGLVLRGLRSGCPLLVAQSDAAGRDVRGWLARCGCAPPAPRTGMAAALSALLGRPREVTEAVERGRAVAAQHGEDRLPARLAAALSSLGTVGRAPTRAA